MRLGVEGKASLWRSLRTVASTDPRLDGAAVDRLLDRARRQADVLEELRVRAARNAFAPTAEARAAAGTGTVGTGTAVTHG